MYTLSPKQIQTCTLLHIAAAVFLALFGAIYEYFSHQVYSYYMIYAFAIPLVLGALPGAIIPWCNARMPRAAAVRLWNCAIATCSVGCLFKGVLDIYGTTHHLLFVYPVAGGALAVAALVLFALQARKG